MRPQRSIGHGSGGSTCPPGRIVSQTGGNQAKSAASNEAAETAEWSHGESNPDLLNAIQPSSR